MERSSAEDLVKHVRGRLYETYDSLRVTHAGQAWLFRVLHKMDQLARLLGEFKAQDGIYFFRFCDGPVVRRVQRGGVLLLEGIDKVSDAVRLRVLGDRMGG